MFASRRPVRLALIAALALPGPAVQPPLAAQPATAGSCAAETRLMNQQGVDQIAAENAWRLYWAQHHPKRLGRYQAQLRAAVAQRQVAPDFYRIADELVYYLMPGLDGEFRLTVQQGLLNLVDRLAATVPVSGTPLPEDPATEARLRGAAVQAGALTLATMTRYSAAQCHLQAAPPAAATASNAPSGDSAALYSRAPSLISGNEASTAQVCAETRAVLEQLEREEREAKDAYIRATGDTDDLELKVQRARYQADLRRKRMADLKCSSLALPPVEPFARRADPSAVPGAQPSTANTAQVCAETAHVLPQLEREEHEAYKFRWAVNDDHHDSYFALVSLRDAIKANKVDDDFDDIAAVFDLDWRNMTQAQKLAAQPALRREVSALAAQARAITGRPRHGDNDPDAADPAAALFDTEDDEMQKVSPEVRRKEREIEETYQQKLHQAEIRRQRLKDLHCDSLPTNVASSSNGSMQRHTTRLKEDYGPPNQRYTYGENWAELLIVGDPPDRRRIRWTWEGVPGSLSPGDAFIIKITGDLDFKPAGAERGANNSAFVEQEGLTALQEDNAYFYQGASREGFYKYQVPLNASRVVIALSADNNQGHFIRHCYGECEK